MDTGLQDLDDYVEQEEEEEVDTSLYPEEVEDKPVDDGKPPALDVKLLGETIAGALGGATERQSQAISGAVAQIAGLLTQPKVEGAPKLSKEQIAARNAAIQARLLDATGDVDLVEELKGLVAPAIRAEIEAEIAKVRPTAQASLEATGEDIVDRAKARLFKGLGAMQERAEEEFDKIVKPQNYSWLASLSAAERKEQLETVKERVLGRLYSSAIEKKTARNVAGGTSGAAPALKSSYQAKLDALPRAQQKAIVALAHKSAKQRGLDPEVDAKKYNAYVRDRINVQLEDDD